MNWIWLWGKNKKKEDDAPKREIVACWENEPQKTAEDLEKEHEKFQKYMELTKDLPKTVSIIGYKAVTANYEAFFGNQKYEIGKTYTESQPIVPCAHGFHFCRTLEDAMELFPPKQGIRYLKVEGEIPVNYYMNADDQVHTTYRSCADLLYAKSMNEYKKNGHWTSPISGHIWQNKPASETFYGGDLNLKYVTNRLTILEEVPFDIYADNALNELIETEEEYRRTIEVIDIEALAQNKWLTYSKSCFSAAFAEYAFNRYVTRTNKSGSTIKKYIEWYKDLIKSLNAIKDEDISQDMRVLLFLTSLNLM